MLNEDFKFIFFVGVGRFLGVRIAIGALVGVGRFLGVRTVVLVGIAALVGRLVEVGARLVSLLLITTESVVLHFNLAKVHAP